MDEYLTIACSILVSLGIVVVIKGLYEAYNNSGSLAHPISTRSIRVVDTWQLNEKLRLLGKLADTKSAKIDDSDRELLYTPVGEEERYIG